MSFALREANAALQQALPPHISCCQWDELRLGPQHCWLVPEGWPQALLLGLQAQANCVIYVQNWAYLLSNLPENMDFARLPLRCLAVSDPVRHFIHHTTGQDCPVLRPAVDPELFFPPDRDAAQAHTLAGGPLRVAYMPRKNTALARQIREAVTARLRHAHPHIQLEWQEIHHKSSQEVAQILRRSPVFLATGFPEGLGLPPLEAMASGCVVVGFAGMGGWDYMRQARPPASPPDNTLGNTLGNMPACAPISSPANMPYSPAFPLRPVPWGGNGFYAADADVLGAAEALEQACLLLYKGGQELATLRQAAASTAAAYSPPSLATAVQALWHDWI